MSGKDKNEGSVASFGVRRILLRCQVLGLMPAEVGLIVFFFSE